MDSNKMAITRKRKETFKYLLEKDCSAFTKKSPANNANYLSWSYAWQEFKKVYPFAYVTIAENKEGTFEFKDSFGTFFVKVTVHNGGEKSCGEYIEEEHMVVLPIMDNKHKPMKTESYEYTTKYGTKTVAGATGFDTNYAIQRAKTKAISDFGLGLYIYHGETIPQESDFITEQESVGSPTLKDCEAEIWKYILSLNVGSNTNNKIWKMIKPSDHFKDGVILNNYVDIIDIMLTEFSESLGNLIAKLGRNCPAIPEGMSKNEEYNLMLTAYNEAKKEEK